MTHQDIIEYGLQKKGSALRYPFDPELPVLFVGKRMFALLGSYGGKPSVNLKADPEEAWLQRGQYPGVVIPGWHMNKKHWNTVMLGSGVPEDSLRQMIDDSYLLAANALPKTVQLELGLL
jgi:predicted DNA-binding protein (MmcQ/YjbR family)